MCTRRVPTSLCMCGGDRARRTNFSSFILEFNQVSSREDKYLKLAIAYSVFSSLSTALTVFAVPLDFSSCFPKTLFTANMPSGSAPSNADADPSQATQGTSITPAPTPGANQTQLIAGASVPVIDLNALLTQLQGDSPAAASIRQALSASGSLASGNKPPTAIKYQWDSSASADSSTQLYFSNRDLHVPKFVYDYVKSWTYPTSLVSFF